MLGGERDDVEEEDDNHKFNVDHDDDMMVKVLVLVYMWSIRI